MVFDNDAVEQPTARKLLEYQASKPTKALNLFGGFLLVQLPSQPTK
jgi:hypothetical protein